MNLGGKKGDRWASVELVGEADGCPARGRDGEYVRGGRRARSGRQASTASTVGEDGEHGKGDNERSRGDGEHGQGVGSPG